MTHAIQATASLALFLCAIAGAQHADPAGESTALLYQDIKTKPPTPRLEKPLPKEDRPVEPRRAMTPGYEPAHTEAGYLAAMDRDRVHFDEPGDGRIWAAADAYKASFGLEGATYIPFFGSRAPRNFPVSFQIAGLRAGGEAIAFDDLVAPVREGDRILFDRGSVVEVWDLRLDEVEQSFVLATPLSGEIVIDLSVQSDLERSSDESGIVLSSGIGSVRYGRAFAVDASAGRTEVESGWRDGAIRIRVPADRVAAAAWPLVVDPIVSTFDVDTGVEEDVNPDVAYDASTGNHIVVYERVFSAADHDLIYHIVDENGVFVHLGEFDITSANWANPHVASNGLLDRFLCVAEVGAVGSRIIRCRWRDAAGNGATGAALTVSGAETGDKYNPDVGGNPNPAVPAYFLVAWQRDFNATDRDVHARLVTGGGALAAGVIFLSNSGGTLDVGPSVSKSCGMSITGSSPRWTVVWVRTVSTFDNDLMGAVIRDDGAILNPPFDIDTTSANTTWPSVSSPTQDASRTTLVAAMRQTSAFGDRSTYGWAMNGSTVAGEANLTTLSGAPNGEEQYYPSVDCDGDSFVVVDQESYQGTLEYDIRASTFFWAANELVLIDGHRFLAFGTPVDHIPEVVCAGGSGGPRRRTMAVWQRGLGSSDILGAIYEPSPFTQLCTPGSAGVASCPCGNAPAPGVRGCNNSSGTGGANLYATGNVDPDTVVLVATQMQPTTVCLFVQGTSFLANGAVFGDGIRCVSGSLVRLATKPVFGGNAWFPINNDPSITQRSAAAGAPITPGTPRYYFVYYRDAGGYACPSTFNTSNVARVIW